MSVFVPLETAHFPMDQRPLVKGRIANIVIPLHVFEFLLFQGFFALKRKGFWGFLQPPYCA